MGFTPDLLGSESDASFAAVTATTVTTTGISDFTTAGSQTQIDTSDTANPPTDAEITSAFGTAASKGAGWVGVMDDAGAGLVMTIAVSDGTNWHQVQLTKAV